ncbi:hydrolase 1, exosortase A system-associated [Motiliproteus coralliicola]|uniref:hydrolase 1, exosortase A system-associated n=1 Tax=Motiliproteus coralliicola TaxID=2283196 RepID=UPI0014039B6B|nr:hydrolase 1, exosortase A system-associated [Motiliproteus coralliicola]
MFNERAVSFDSGDRLLNGIIHPVDGAKTGVLIVVGGPQYRVGSHRQFVHLARDFALQGVPAMRFDVTGMGDSEGDKITFDRLDQDICAALDSFCAEAELERVVLWGLCDGASAALIYAPEDPRVAGLVLVNPWLENEEARAKTYLFDYYLKRLFSQGFWRKLLKGQISVAASAKELGGTVKKASTSTEANNAGRSYQQRMLMAFGRLQVPVAWFLSGDDLTAKEFERCYLGDARWRGYAAKNRVTTFRLEAADHTFSSTAWKQWLANHTVKFISDHICQINRRDYSQ